MDNTVLDGLPTSNGHKHMGDILREEVDAAIGNLKNRKAPGEDNIAAEMIQTTGKCSVEMLHVLCNKIYQDRKRNFRSIGEKQ